MNCLLIFVLSLGLGSSPALGQSSPSKNKSEASTLEIAKKPRKKKAQMCAECGKPESECECHGHKQKADSADSEEGSPEDAHSH